MAILMMMEAEGANEEQYRALNDHMRIHGDEDAPDGLISHVAGRTDEGLVVVDVWESEEKLDAFFRDRLQEALEAAGVDAGAPTILPVHSMIADGGGTDPGVIVLIDIPGVDTEAYDRMTSKMEAHTGDGSDHPAVSHTAARTDGGLFIVDVWESPEAFGEFARTQVAPAGEEIGMGPIEPRIVPAINRIRGAGG